MKPVAEIKDEYKSYNEKQLKKVSGYPESVIEKDIVIAYAGTTMTDSQDWKTNGREIGLNDKHDNGAFQSAVDYANEIEKKYSDKEGYRISSTGHSLGGAEAIYVAVLNGYDAFTYGAAGSGLSESQIQGYTGQVVNLYDTSDMVTTGLVTGGKDRIPFYSFGIDNAGWETAGHSLKQFELDDQGNYIDKHGDIVVYTDFQGGISIEQTLLKGQVIQNKKEIRQMELNRYGTLAEKEYIESLEAENRWLERQIEEFSVLVALRSKLTTSGGGLSYNEEIYLEDQQALTVIKILSSKFDEAMENVLTIYREGLVDIEDNWARGVETALSAAPDLSYEEVMDALREVDCTKQSMVDLPSEAFIEKMNKVNQMSSKFSVLTEEISSKINELVDRDHELGAHLA
ncbi:hypothetical protein [Marinilactibacillus psychrotolerans]|uniref:DUF2974 domain-containing protein n=1 Tax=Marinilactibacillus psychrotolerans TaxID=191770 RepID=A0AAV3WQ74_9LACT|nr:hypothetical protein [Marinilactibacillus psychrotolerans]GEL67117.1 hypothetical protein MPS01_12720 [Marinilactibacillus psychrotolerans]GEQ35470.1 hypothetical protein M132T_09780 [Marinilactibacillus psychrotolerans]SDC87523.1 Protein of unknown function [Marinilactibacillus psychrotolerans]